MKRYYIVYKGRVQGVGFRWKLMTLADQLNVTGFARNLDNGDVEVEAQGEEVDAFFKGTFNKDYWIRIDDYAIKEIPVVENEKHFSVRY